MQADLEWGKEPAKDLLAGNPELQLHHITTPTRIG